MSAPSKYDVFLSYNTQDQQSVEIVARTLKQHGLDVFLDRWYLVPGLPWPQHLEEILRACKAAAIFLGPSGMGRWQQREQYMALDRQAHEPTFPVIPVLLPGTDPALGFLSLNTWIDLRHGLDDVRSLNAFAEAVRGNAPGSDLQQIPATLVDVCPYRGLRFFREEDAPFFFGRESFIARLAAMLQKHRFVAVVGASGSGKSSVVRAGLVPHLRKGDKDVWEIATMIPGDRPLHALAAVLVPLLEPAIVGVDRLGKVGELAKHLAAGNIKLRDGVSQALEKQPGTDRLLLIVDQWEELYTLTRDDEHRQLFLDELLDATSSGALSIILTLRGDFFDRLLEYRPLADRLEDAVVNVSPMTVEEIREVIQRPAEKVGLNFEPGLIERILDKVENRPGYLPLLEFVLTELWKERRQGSLTHVAYEKIGQVEGAIASWAESVFNSLSATEQGLARRIFLQLVQPAIEERKLQGGEIEYTRRRTTFSEIDAESQNVARKLADAHLLVTGRDNASGEETIDLVHEAIIRAWTRLRGWLEEEQDFLIWRARLRAFMVLWTEDSVEKTTLLKGPFLKEASDHLRSRPSDLTSSEQKYIGISVEEQKKALRWNYIKIGSIVLGALLVVGILFFQYQSSSNTNNTNEQKAQASPSPSPIANNANEQTAQTSPSPSPNANDQPAQASPSVRSGIIDSDDRSQVSNTNVFPWNAVCFLLIEKETGVQYFNTGVLIGPRVVLTSAHSIFLDGRYARSVLVAPGRNGNIQPFGVFRGATLRAADKWVNNQDQDSDYAIIVLDKKVENVPPVPIANLTDEELLRSTIALPGYPGEKSGTLWFSAGKVTSVTTGIIQYLLDTSGGMGGAPIYVGNGENTKVVGLHVRSTPAGKVAIRINSEVFANVNRWMDEFK